MSLDRQRGSEFGGTHPRAPVPTGTTIFSVEVAAGMVVCRNASKLVLRRAHNHENPANTPPIIGLTAV